MHELNQPKLNQTILPYRQQTKCLKLGTVMQNMFERTNWEGAYNFLTSGSPPLILELLAINTIFLVLFILRRMTGIYSRKAHTSYLVQILLIASNVGVLMQGELAPYAEKALSNLNLL
jgi:hypothetical protein